MVIFAHIYHGELSRAIYLFHMPLFALTTGCLLSFHKSFSVRLYASRILVPYFVFSFLSYIYWATIEVQYRNLEVSRDFYGLFLDSPKLQQFCNIFVAKAFDGSFAYNIVLWYLPCLFSARLIYEALQRCNKLIAIVGIAVMLGVQIVIAPYYSFPWELELACIFVLLFFSGRFLY